MFKYTKRKRNLVCLELRVAILSILLSFLFATISSTLLANPRGSQFADGVNVTLDFKKARLTDVLRGIERQTEFKFSWHEDVETISNVSISCQSKPLNDVLNELTKLSYVEFRQVDKMIAVSKTKKTSLREEQPQDRRISGTVKDSNTGDALAGASVQVKNTTRGTITGSNGEFTLELSDNDSPVLIISFIGYKPQEVEVSTQTTLAISLEPDVTALAEMVVIGYGTTAKRDITASIGSVKAEDLANQPVSGFDQALVGKLAGVQVQQTNGAPGSNISIRVRGVRSISAGNDPLYVVDGIPLSNDVKKSGTNVYTYDSPVNPLNSLNPNDIESIEVLKDASAASIYGSRGSGGVVIITTKKGKNGKPQITYNGYVGVQSVTKKIDLLGAYDWAQYAKDAHDNAYLDAYPTASAGDINSIRSGRPATNTVYLVPDELTPYVNGQEGLTDTDWQDEIFRTAKIENHTVSISAAKDGLSYYMSADYFDQEGVVINSGYKRYGARVNVSYDYDKLKVGVNFNPSYSTTAKVHGEGPYSDQGVVSTALTYSPIWPVYNNDGSYNFGNNVWCCGHTAQINPVALAQLTESNLAQVKLIGNIYAGYEIMEGLNLKVSFGSDINNYTYDYYRPSTLENLNVKGPANPLGTSRATFYTNWINENTLNYRKQFGNHDISALAGYTIQKEQSTRNYIDASDFPNDQVQTLNAGIVKSGGSEKSEWSILSYLARVQYSFKGKYLLSSAIRTDGSSRFGTGNKWGYFPSVSAGWQISDEEFMKAIPAVNELKLRASYGVTGNFQIPNYGPVSLLSPDNYILGSGDGKIVSGLYPSSAANDELSWEKTGMTDIGLDATFFKGKIGLTIDYYDSKTNGLLLNVPVPQLSGFTSALKNVGQVSNKGWEFTLSSSGSAGAFKWRSSVNLSVNKNKVLALSAEGTPVITSGGNSTAQFITRVGDPIGSYYTLVQNGVYLNQAEIDNSPHFPNAKPGDFKFQDVNGDGQVTTADQDVTGNYMPDFTYGMSNNFSYKSFDLGVMIQGTQGNEIMNLQKRYLFNMEGNYNSIADVRNRWVSPDNVGDGLTPRANRRTTGNNTVSSNWLIEDGSYLRIRNVTLGYTIPVSVTQKIAMSKIRFYVTAQNPFTFTKYSGFNPEVSSRPDNALSPGEDFGTYPLAKSYMIGLNVTF